MIIKYIFWTVLYIEITLAIFIASGNMQVAK